MSKGLTWVAENTTRSAEKEAEGVSIAEAVLADGAQLLERHSGALLGLAVLKTCQDISAPAQHASLLRMASKQTPMDATGLQEAAAGGRTPSGPTPKIAKPDTTGAGLTCERSRIPSNA